MRFAPMVSAALLKTRIGGSTSALYRMLVSLLLLNHLGVLLGVPLRPLAVVTLLVVVVFAGMNAYWHRAALRRSPDKAWVIAILIAMLGYQFLNVRIDWDGWSIWLFHGKIMYFDGAYDPARFANFDYGGEERPHTSYPMLVSGIAAQIAALAGYWNEPLPKLAHLVLAAVATIGFFALKPRLSISLLILYFLLIKILAGTTFFAGYMDGLLYLYIAMALLHFGTYLTDRSSERLKTAIYTLGVICLLKQEGAMAVVLLAVAISLVLGRSVLRTITRENAYSLWVFLPFGFYQGIVATQGMESPSLSGGLSGMVERATSRSADEATMVLHALVFSDGNSLVPLCAGLLALALVFALLIRRRIARPVWFVMGFAALYNLGLFGVYLATKYPLAWILGSSALRTGSTLGAGMLVAAYFAFSMRSLRGKAPA